MDTSPTTDDHTLPTRPSSACVTVRRMVNVKTSAPASTYIFSQKYLAIVLLQGQRHELRNPCDEQPNEAPDQPWPRFPGHLRHWLLGQPASEQTQVDNQKARRKERQRQQMKSLNEREDPTRFVDRPADGQVVEPLEIGQQHQITPAETR